ncbi:long-chain-fatty-acid--CoA ligase [Neobacillus massiliamazoniensis]|uniref:Long-chain-fatty-acid--CoA ligase n=1 Tax=Neobacillus massiliamazoniensis TaxID=1499688 RepID=A0A0U1NYM9_9BACI|nr:long-chain-fatty-acid--CoA ligase [Neobacillus massiliamazoniensis]CRK82958.1 long-chain-fatty-acid--CoA ligase [Neobacillus massiliamazoniensis]
MSYNLDENLRRSAMNYPNSIACIYEDKSVTYHELNKQVEGLAAGLFAQGIKKGDGVALILGNSPEFVIAYYGILRLGAYVVPINPMFTKGEINYILHNSQAKAVISQVSVEHKLKDIRDQLENLKLVIYTDAEDHESTWKQLIETNNNNYENPFINEENLAVILYTSGTTGKPKGAMLTHKNLASNADAISKLIELNDKDRVVAVLPMFHVFCMTICLNAPIACGATVLIMPKFSPLQLVSTIRERKVTVFAGVPTMYNFLYQFPDSTAEDFLSIRVCISGGASIPVELLQKFENKFNVFILEGYGLSETAPLVAINPLKGIRKPGSIGLNIPGVKTKVVNEEGKQLPRGVVGELVVQGPNVMKGYLGMLEATSSALIDGWVYTGDLATVDEDGYIYIVDRKKDIIIIGGYNVYPREVEEVLFQHPAVVEAAVIGIPDGEYGEKVKAFIAVKDEQISENDIIQFCQERLVKYKLPNQVEFLRELPKNSTGKILRRELRQLIEVKL